MTKFKLNHYDIRTFIVFIRYKHHVFIVSSELTLIARISCPTIAHPSTHEFNTVSNEWIFKTLTLNINLILSRFIILNDI